MTLPVPLTYDQILLSDLLLTPLTFSTENYLNRYYHSIGGLISATYGGDEPKRALLSELILMTNSANLVEFLLKHDYIAPGRHEGQFKLTPLGLKVKESGGHQRYLDHLESIKQQEQADKDFTRYEETLESNKILNKLKKFVNTPLGAGIIGGIRGAIVGGLVETLINFV